MSPESRFRAMGVEVVVGGAAAAELDAIRALFETWDATFSRFRPDSELRRVNASRLPVALVSPVFARILSAALSAAADTCGLVDPTLGVAIEAAGYDRDFEQLSPDPRPPGLTSRGRWRDVHVVGGLLRRPRGIRLDLNGVVKALAVDAALGLIDGPGYVAAGGDVAARREVVVGLPAGGAVRLRDGALATSGVTKRRWMRGGKDQHHLIDPRTGRPARSLWSEVTVAAPTCFDADIAAKAAFLLSEDGPTWLDARGLAGHFDGVPNEGWKRAA